MRLQSRSLNQRDGCVWSHHHTRLLRHSLAFLNENSPALTPAISDCLARGFARCCKKTAEYGSTSSFHPNQTQNLVWLSPVLQRVFDILLRIRNNLTVSLLIFSFSCFLRRYAHKHITKSTTQVHWSQMAKVVGSDLYHNVAKVLPLL